MNVFIQGQHYPITGTSGRGVYTTRLEGAMLQCIAGLEQMGPLSTVRTDMWILHNKDRQ